MKPSKIKPIVFSAIAFLLMIVTLACVFSLVFFHIQHKDTLGTSQSRPSPADPIPSSPVPTSSDTPTVSHFFGNAPRFGRAVSFHSGR